MRWTSGAANVATPISSAHDGAQPFFPTKYRNLLLSICHVNLACCLLLESDCVLATIAGAAIIETCVKLRHDDGSVAT